MRTAVPSRPSAARVEAIRAEARRVLDGNWREDKMSEADYMKVFADAEGRYTRALELLLAEAKK